MGESRIIVVANQKGGAGKSTLCMLLANYLTSVANITVDAIVDTDYQQSIVKRREEDKVRIEGTDKATLYQVASYSLTNVQTIPEFVGKLRKTGHTYIIDTPGALNETGVASFLALADYIICPFDYDRLTLKSTTEFLLYWNKLKEQIKQQSGYEIKTEVILVQCGKPKQVGTRQEKELWELLKEGFSKFAHIAPEIPDSSSIRNCDTVEITPKQKEVAGEALAFITSIIYDTPK